MALGTRQLVLICRPIERHSHSHSNGLGSQNLSWMNANFDMLHHITTRKPKRTITKTIKRHKNLMKVKSGLGTFYIFCTKNRLSIFCAGTRACAWCNCWCRKPRPISVNKQPHRSTQPGHPSTGWHNEYQPMSQRAVTLCGWEAKAGMVCAWVTGKTVWFPS